jgi:triosephosphate isomerase (TIM)
MTSAARRPLIAGNWKMHGLSSSLDELDRIIAGADADSIVIDLMICPPATILAACAARARGTRVTIGAQDCHAEASGAFTGDISAEMLKDAGATAVIVGHAERRIYHRETDADVHAKVLAAWRAGLQAIVCVGETREQRADGQTLSVVVRQLVGSLPDDATAANLIMAYEPVWAIGTGLTPTPIDIVEVHDCIRSHVLARFGATGEAIRILYGGSVKPSNAAELLAVDNVDGALVGGASLHAQEFLAIARAR